ncbi:hypothetical protein [Gordonia shandongensis]|uniref:hypothetical protein n=1 Tax=Gordonia shandongensis TaxID=376351 RepID=UPI0004027AD5|nr:hypothetical protein [Gordonia shandongensis]
MKKRLTGAVLALGIAGGASLVAGATVGSGEAAAMPYIVCSGAACTNYGDMPGIGMGQYRCPNGLVYPSIAVVMPHSTAPVMPVNCPSPPNLFG